MQFKDIHNFHIPVMGLAYTIDTPIRVAHLGISSVISVMDDELLERLNKLYSEKFELPYKEISKKVQDYRAKRITSYLDLVDVIVTKKFNSLKTELLQNTKRVEEFLELIPDHSTLKQKAIAYISHNLNYDSFKQALDLYLKPGSIDVNIMTKVDRQNYQGQQPLPEYYNDAHAALRGFAQSTVCSSLVLSAGMNPKLFSYFEAFDAFYPQAGMELKKKVVLKVSDYRSALIQGSFLAKKGIWVSEYRIESGLNCGGHAFATEGHLLGPILEDFKTLKPELIQQTFALLCKALEGKKRYIPKDPLPVKITVQGGVGTSEEHTFLLDYFQVDSVGWGSPFLLVPQATSVDTLTRDLLAKAQEQDLYLSDLSPLGIPFNTVKNTSNDLVNTQRENQGKIGSSCPRKYLALDKTYDPKGLCTASRSYITKHNLALEGSTHPLNEKHQTPQNSTLKKKSCLCIALANASLLEHNLPIKGQDQGVAICPGPNIAYFDKQVSLPAMINHIYGRDNILGPQYRPHFFIKELHLYVKHYQQRISQLCTTDLAGLKKVDKFKTNLLKGIAYYQDLFAKTNSYFSQDLDQIHKELHQENKNVLGLFCSGFQTQLKHEVKPERYVV